MSPGPASCRRFRPDRRGRSSRLYFISPPGSTVLCLSAGLWLDSRQRSPSGLNAAIVVKGLTSLNHLEAAVGVGVLRVVDNEDGRHSGTVLTVKLCQVVGAAAVELDEPEIRLLPVDAIRAAGITQTRALRSTVDTKPAVPHAQPRLRRESPCRSSACRGRRVRPALRRAGPFRAVCTGSPPRRGRNAAGIAGACSTCRRERGSPRPGPYPVHRSSLTWSARSKSVGQLPTRL